MIDIYRSRRGHFYQCLYWKRDESGVMNNSELVLKVKPSGIFYAKIVSNNEKNSQDVAGVFRVPYEGVTILTEDKVDIRKDDLVFFNNGKWIVDRISEEIIQKNAEFGERTGKITSIVLRTGV